MEIWILSTAAAEVLTSPAMRMKLQKQSTTNTHRWERGITTSPCIINHNTFFHCVTLLSSLFCPLFCRMWSQPQFSHVGGFNRFFLFFQPLNSVDFIHPTGFHNIPRVLFLFGSSLVTGFQSKSSLEGLELNVPFLSPLSLSWVLAHPIGTVYTASICWTDPFIILKRRRRMSLNSAGVLAIICFSNRYCFSNNKSY